MSTIIKVVVIAAIGVAGFYACGVSIDGEIARQDNVYDIHIN